MFTSFLIRLFVPDAAHPEKPPVRLRFGLLAGGVGIAVNLLLFILKLCVAAYSGSIAVAADAVNNLSDAGSAIITLIGFKISGRPPDKEHPFGHGRMEYIAGLIVAVLILTVGLNFLEESIMKIITPTPVEIPLFMIGLLGASVLFKLWLFLFYRAIGKRIHSTVIAAAAFDSLSDIFSTGVVIAALLLLPCAPFPLDGAAGVVVALWVLKGGWEILQKTINPLLGEMPDKHLVEQVEKILLAQPAIRGVHDLILHNYGPNLYFATAHAEVDRSLDLFTIHDLLEHAERAVAQELPVKIILHCDPFEVDDPEIKNFRAHTEEAVSQLNPMFKLYDFRLSKNNDAVTLHFDLLIPWNEQTAEDELTQRLTEKLQAYHSPVALNITFIRSYVS